MKIHQTATFIYSFVDVSATVKEFWKSINTWRRYGQKLSAYFSGPPCRTGKCRTNRQ